jgi:hypothetical protein
MVQEAAAVGRNNRVDDSPTTSEPLPAMIAPRRHPSSRPVCACLNMRVDTPMTTTCEAGIERAWACELVSRCTEESFQRSRRRGEFELHLLLGLAASWNKHASLTSLVLPRFSASRVMDGAVLVLKSTVGCGRRTRQHRRCRRANLFPIKQPCGHPLLARGSSLHRSPVAEIGQSRISHLASKRTLD